MPNKNKSMWIVLVLVIGGAVILLLSSQQHNSSSDKVVMQEIFDQKSSTVSANPQADKDPVPSPAIVTSPERGKEGGFAVQVYSFRDEKRTDAALNNLKNAGFNAYVQISDLGEKGTWYRVRIGGLKNDEEAKAMLETIRKNFKSGIIVKSKT